MQNLRLNVRQIICIIAIFNPFACIVITVLRSIEASRKFIFPLLKYMQIRFISNCFHWQIIDSSSYGTMSLAGSTCEELFRGYNYRLIASILSISCSVWSAVISIRDEYTSKWINSNVIEVRVPDLHSSEMIAKFWFANVGLVTIL
eukprot:87076_1